MVSTPIKKLAALGAFALFAAGCSGGGGLDGATPSTGTTTPTANIFGLVTANSLGFYSVPGKVTASDFRKPGKFTVTGIEGCAVKAYDVMSGSQVGASATTDANGKYTIDGLDAGEAYKIVADCGNNGKFASVETSDMSAPADKSPVVTDPLSSLVAAKVIQSIYDAVGSALDSMTGVSDSVKSTIKRTLLETVVPSLTAQIKSAITEAVKTGAMEVPSANEASSLTTAVASTTETSKTALETATTSYETVKSIPPSVTKTFEGAKSDAGAMVACSSTYGGTVEACTRALAKLMFNGLGFNIILKTSGGVFGGNDGFTCSDTDPELVAEFQNFTAATSVQGNPLTGACLISSKLKRLDRNARAEDNNDKGGGPLFSETFNMDGQAGEELGYISALGTAMFNNYSYRLSDIDKLIFGFDAQTKAGLNSRLMQMRFGNDGPPKLAYLNGSSWTLADHPALANGPWPLFQCMEADAQGAYSAKNEEFNFWVNSGSCPQGATGSNGNCSMNCSTFSDIITTLSSNNFTTASIFEKSFGGPIPTATELEDQFDNGRTHMDNNPSGQAYLWVLWDAFPMWEKRTCVDAQSASCQEGSQGCVCTSTRPCDTNSTDFNPNECKAADGENGSVHTVRVNLTFGSTITDANAKFKGFKPITSMTKATNGRYYLSPIWDMNGFSGLFNIVDGQTGTYLRDDYGNFRSIKVIVKPNTVNTTKECSTNLHGAMTGCVQGKIYKVV